MDEPEEKEDNGEENEGSTEIDKKASLFGYRNY